MTQFAPLIAEDVSCKYGDTLVVDGANLTLEPGQITALLGQSGAGKSTLLRLFSGLQSPDSGRILHGDDILSDGGIIVPAERRRIGLAFQDFALFPNLTAAQNIAFGLTHLSKADQQQRAADWLQRISLTARADAYPHQMSGGEQQRVAIARALAPDPVAILMDEPFSGLDPALRDDVRQMALGAIKSQDIPALLVTHNASEAMLFADHLAIMRNGHILQQGSAETLYATPVDEHTATALGPMIKLHGVWNADAGQVETALGSFPHKGPTPASDITIGIRPEAFALDPTSSIKAKVLSIRRNGPLLQVEIVRNGTQKSILLPDHDSIHTSEDIGLRLNPSLCFVF